MTFFYSHKNLIVASCISLALSFFLFAWYNDWVIITIPARQPEIIEEPNSSHTKNYKKKVMLFFTKQEKEQHETKEMVWSERIDDNVITLLQAWLQLLYEEEVLHKKTTLQTAAISVTHDELVVSFDRAPWNKEEPGYKKCNVLKTLFKTLNKEIPSLQKIRFLVHHQPLHDIHIDCSEPIPITLFEEQSNALSHETPTWLKQPAITIMLDPAGDARHTGRIIDDTFERSITAKCAQELKSALEARLPGARVILTRFPGETIEPLQNAAFANRIHAHVYISIQCYQTQHATPHCALYVFARDSLVNRHQKPQNVSLIPLSRAYYNYAQGSSFIVSKLAEFLKSKPQAQRYVFDGIYAFPYTPLIGVHSAALGIELGLAKKENWPALTEALQEALVSFFLAQRR